MPLAGLLGRRIAASRAGRVAAAAVVWIARAALLRRAGASGVPVATFLAAVVPVAVRRQGRQAAAGG